MSITNVTTGNLGINVLGHEEYDTIQNKLTSELYVVKNENSDTDNSISSRTYADVGRYAVHYGPTAPTSEYAKIWVDTSEDPILITPASVDMNNLSSTGVKNLETLVTPDYSRGTALSLNSGDTYTLPSTGWIYITDLSTGSEIKLLLTDLSGVVLTHLKGLNGEILSDRILLNKNDVIYVDTMSGSMSISFYPCRSSV